MSRRHLSKVATDISIRITIVSVFILFFVFAIGFMTGLGFVTVFISGSN